LLIAMADALPHRDWHSERVVFLHALGAMLDMQPMTDHAASFSPASARHFTSANHLETRISSLWGSACLYGFLRIQNPRAVGNAVELAAP
jgi:hypothetical protein